MGNRCVLAVTLCAFACSKPPEPVRPEPRARTTKHYEPLAMKADAKRPGQAVILGTDGADGSTLLLLASAPQTAVIDALFVAAGGRATGSTIAVTVGAAPSAALVPATPDARTAPGAVGAVAPAAPPSAPGGGAVVVGQADAGGTAWQAGLWSAALVAAAALDKDATDLTFSAAPPVPGDHPTASAVVAAGFLATLTGEKIDPAAAVAGAIQPDGTIGPVAGLPEQLLAAIARGKTRLGFPSGMRVARSLATGKDVDLVRLARAHRAEAIELAGVHDAYQLLTRAPLPAAVPVSEDEMALDAATLERLDARYLEWRKRLADEWAQLLQLEQSGRLPAAVKLQVRFAHERSEQAEALYRAGKLPAAYTRMATAWASAAAANAAHAVLVKLAAGDIDGAAAALSAAGAPEATTGALLAKIGALRPATLAGHLAMVAAFQAVLRGWSYDAFAADSIRVAMQQLGGYKDRPASELGAPATHEAVASAVVPAALMKFRAIAENDLADQELEPDHGTAHACSPADVKRLAAVFQRAAAAGLRHVDGLLVEPLAHRAGLGEPAARERVASTEPDYLIADMLSRTEAGLPHDFATSWGERSMSASLLELAGHELAYHQAAILIAKYGSLAVRADAAGRIDAVAHPAALRNLLANAARTARAHARAARVAAGAIPLQAKLAYQLATVEAAGSVADQLDALSALWTTSMYSQLAVALARN
jgi:uncharacterized protein